MGVINMHINTIKRVGFYLLLPLLLASCGGEPDWESEAEVNSYINENYKVDKVLFDAEGDDSSRRLSIFFDTKDRFSRRHCAISQGVARVFINKERRLLGVRPFVVLELVDTAKVKSVASDQALTQHTFRTSVNGTPIDGWEVKVSVKGNCKLKSMSATTFRITDELIAKLNNADLIDQEEATVVLDELLKAELIADLNLPLDSFETTNVRLPTRDILGRSLLAAERKVIKQSPYVVWEVLANKRYIIDAETGEVLEAIDDVIIN